MSYRLLAQGQFWMTNKMVARRFGIETATFLAELVTKYLYHKDRGELINGELFFYTAEDLEEATTLSYHKQKRCLALLEEAGFVEQKLLGVPVKLHFKIIEHQISNFLNTGVEKTSNLYNKKEVIINKDNNYIVQGNLERPTPKIVKKEEDEEFLRFWELYDKKVGKDKTLKLWSKLKKTEKERVFEVLPKYVKSQPDKQFRKNPDTWLRNRGWEDEIIEKENGYSDYDRKRPHKVTAVPNDPRGFSTI